MSSKFLAELFNDYEKLFETEMDMMSKYFRTAFSNEWAEKNDGKFILRKPNILPHLFNIILRFIYCGNIELKNLQGPDVLKLLIAVDELNIQQLVSHIQEYLIEHQTEFLYQNPTDGKKFSTAKLGYIKKLNNAIYCSNSQGPHMGYFYCKGHNIWNTYSDNTICYPDVGIQTSDFSVDCYEVFQVIKK
ncbi:unnamed protein product [Rhizophagus irregularis]|nr:unnamed protein product [Rhizophagus irregularis]